MAMQDMVPPNEESKSIRNLRINKEKETKDDNSDKIRQKDEASSGQPVGLRENNYRRRNKSYKGWIIALGAVIVVFIFIALTPVLSNAKVDVTPKSQAVEIDGQFVVGAQTSGVEADLFYQVATFEVIGEERVEAAGEEEVNTRASGRIRVFNNFSEENEALIANTRFESEEGLIYRVQDAFVVPGMTESNGETIPGRVDVTVFADEPGQSYNVSNTEFTIPGLAGDPRFEAMHAETITAIEGGFSGVRKVANDEDVNQALEILEEQTREEVVEKSSSEIPEEFVMIPGATSVSFERISDGDTGQDDSLLVRGRASATVALLKKSELASFIAQETIGTYDESEEVRIDSIENITIEPQPEEGSSVEEAVTANSSIEVSIEGSPTIIWVVDYESLEGDLLGASQSEAEEVLGGYSSIKEARISISPFWKNTIPENIEKLEINETIEQ